MKQGTWVDKAIKIYCYALAAAPTFWLALILLMVFSVYLGWFPIGLSVPIGVTADNVTFFDWFKRLILPALTLSLLDIAKITMFTREKLIEVLSSDYVLFAKSRGEKGLDLVLRHVYESSLYAVHFDVYSHFLSNKFLVPKTILKNFIC